MCRSIRCAIKSNIVQHDGLSDHAFIITSYKKEHLFSGKISIAIYEASVYAEVRLHKHSTNECDERSITTFALQGLHHLSNSNLTTVV